MGSRREFLNGIPVSDVSRRRSAPVLDRLMEEGFESHCRHVQSEELPRPLMPAHPEIPCPFAIAQ
jgi:hypothetical protein